MFVPSRADARYCSAACRQQAHRSRAGVDDLDREIEAARLHYWRLLARKAQALGVNLSQVMTAEAQYIDLDGNVFMGQEALTGRGRPAGRTSHHRPGWDVWGLEAAGPPWSPPPPSPPMPKVRKKKGE
jgi:hypothetical protein